MGAMDATIETPAGRLAGARSRRDQLAAFRASRRHTILVRTLRILFPLTALGFAGFYASTLGGTLLLRAKGVTFKQIEVTADDLKMKAPVYNGQTKDGGRFEVRAREAAVDFGGTGPIKLFGIDSDLIQASGVKATLTADRGLFDNKKSELELFENIRVDATNGMKARLSHAMVYQKEHRIVSNEPVTAEMPAGTIRSSRMTLQTQTRVAAFDGNVQVRLLPSASQTANRPSIGLGRDNRQPIDVVSERLDVDDTKRFANFQHNVTAVQGDLTLQAAELYVTYEGKTEIPGAPPAKSKSADPANPEDAARLKRMQAKTGVIITSAPDRRVTSDAMDYDAIAETVVFTGQSVVVNQARNVMQGRRLAVDRKTGKARLDAPAAAGIPEGRIKTLFYQNDAKVAAAAVRPKGQPAEADAGSGLFGQFKSDPNAPIDIDATTLDIDDTQKLAIYRGNVRAQQGDFIVQSVELHAFYTGSTGLTMAPGAPSASSAASGQAAQLSRVEARQKVVVTSKDGQSATGENAVFDVKANTVTLTGKTVFLQQGRNTTECSTVVIDLTTSLSTCSAGPAGLTPQPPPRLTPLESQPSTSQPAAPGAPVAATPAGTRMRATLYPNELKQKAAERERQKSSEQGAGAATSGWQSSTTGAPAQRTP